MTQKQARELFIHLFTKVQDSAMNFDQAANELMKLYDLEAEKQVWREQAREEGIFGRSYL